MGRIGNRIAHETAVLRTLEWRMRYGRYVTCGRSAIRTRGVQVRASASTLRISLAEGAFIVGPMSIQGSGSLTVGRRSYINQFTVIGVTQAVTIGDHCLIASGVGIRDSDHRFDDPDRLIMDQGVDVAPISIGDDVWVGHGATILKGVTVGNGAVIAAGAVVNHDVGDGEIVGGIPARVLKMRGARAATQP